MGRHPAALESDRWSPGDGACRGRSAACWCSSRDSSKGVLQRCFLRGSGSDDGCKCTRVSTSPSPPCHGKVGMMHSQADCSAENSVLGDGEHGCEMWLHSFVQEQVR